MLPQRLSAILLFLPLLAILLVSIRYWIDFGKEEKHNSDKQNIAYNKFYLTLLGIGFFSIWLFWLGGTGLFFLNRYYELCGYMISSLLLNSPLQIFGFIIFYLSSGFLIWTLYFAGKYLRPSISGVHADHKLIKNGPLGVVRNPYYVSYVLLLFSLVLILSTFVPLFFIFCVVTGMGSAVKAEEEQMATLFGDEFQQYKQKVGRFFPKFPNNSF